MWVLPSGALSAVWFPICRECHGFSRETYSWVMTSCPSRVSLGDFKTWAGMFICRSPLSGGWWFIVPTPCLLPLIVHPSCPDCPLAPDLTPVCRAKLQVRFNTKLCILPTSSLWPFLPSIFSGIWDPLRHETNKIFIRMEARPCLYLFFPRGESISVHTCFFPPGFVLDECPWFCLFVCLLGFVLFLFKVR